ncbi:hypothetical protein [Pararhodobacter sp. CCB-MM2]|uniref:hypothetical protein n=1 Tax=Pararhodobacter sp. CCB-MM2 TaxID=1786003 RepID=UPI0011126EA1|nr:hypothetical protein [Pararhodobacter sp. CCB-MM2]
MTIVDDNKKIMQVSWNRDGACFRFENCLPKQHFSPHRAMETLKLGKLPRESQAKSAWRQCKRDHPAPAAVIPVCWVVHGVVPRGSVGFTRLLAAAAPDLHLHHCAHVQRRSSAEQGKTSRRLLAGQTPVSRAAAKVANATGGRVEA